MSAPQNLPGKYDGIAILASGLCLAHCLALPALFLLIPASAAWLSVPESYHLWMLAFALPSSALALHLGKKRHRRWTPTAVALPGFLALAVGALLFQGLGLETLLTDAGAASLAVAHSLNGKYRRAESS